MMLERWESSWFDGKTFFNVFLEKLMQINDYKTFPQKIRIRNQIYFFHLKI